MNEGRGYQAPKSGDPRLEAVQCVILVVLADNNVSYFNYVTPRNTQLYPSRDSHTQEETIDSREPPVQQPAPTILIRVRGVMSQAWQPVIIFPVTTGPVVAGSKQHYLIPTIKR